jgi:hypothetical protein
MAHSITDLPPPETIAGLLAGCPVLPLAFFLFDIPVSALVLIFLVVHYLPLQYLERWCEQTADGRSVEASDSNLQAMLAPSQTRSCTC